MQQSPEKPRRRWKLILLSFAAGMLAVVSTGLAVKWTDQPMFCANCHSMSEQVWTHKNSIHAKVECNECHTPHALYKKLPFKAYIGVWDIYVTTLSDVPDSVHATGQMKDIIQANCRRCHTATTMSVAMDVKPYCTDCHRSVPHNSKLPIDKRRAADV